MSSWVEPCSIMKKANEVEGDIKDCTERVDKLEKKLKYGEIPPSKVKEVHRELEEVRKLLDSHNKQLKSLHSHNRTSFKVAVMLCFVFFALYLLSMLIWGK